MADRGLQHRMTEAASPSQPSPSLNQFPFLLDQFEGIYNSIVAPTRCHPPHPHIPGLQAALRALGQRTLLREEQELLAHAASQPAPPQSGPERPSARAEMEEAQRQQVGQRHVGGNLMKNKHMHIAHNNVNCRVIGLPSVGVSNAQTA